MTVRPAVTAAVGAVLALVLLNGCTSDSSGGPSAAPPPTPTHLTPTQPTPTQPPPTPSASAPCAQSSTRLTYHRHQAVTATYEVDVAPGSKVTASLANLAPATVVVARARGLGTGAGLTRAVSHHWHTHAAALGQTTRTHDSGSIRVRGHGRHNEAFVVYRVTSVFTGAFTSSCGGHTARGTYTTFGPFSVALAQCHGGHPGRLEKRARAVGCI